MDTNERVAEPTLIAPGATEVDALTSLPCWLSRAGKTGLKWSCYVAGPILGLLLIVSWPTPRQLDQTPHAPGFPRGTGYISTFNEKLRWN
jgi:hypothetical protein